MGFVIDMLVGVLSSVTQQVSDKLESLDGDDESGSECGLSSQNETGTIVAAQILVFSGVDVNNVVPALESFVVRKKDEALGVRVQLPGGLLDNRPPLVNLGQGLIAEIVGLQDVWLDVLVGLGQVGQDGGGKGFVRGVTELEGLLAVWVRLEGLDAVVDNRVGSQVLHRWLARDT